MALNYALWLTWFAGFGPAIIASLIAMVSIYCWACILIKRLRFSGASAFLYIPIMAGFLFTLIVIVPLFLNVIMPVSEESIAKTTTLMEENTKLSQLENPTMSDIAPVIELLLETNQMTALRSAINFFISGALVAFGVNRFLPVN